MASKRGRAKPRKNSSRPAGRSAGRGGGTAALRPSSPVEELLLAALERGEEGFQTGRYLVTYKEGAAGAGEAALGSLGLRVARASDFAGQ